MVTTAQLKLLHVHSVQLARNVLTGQTTSIPQTVLLVFTVYWATHLAPHVAQVTPSFKVFIAFVLLVSSSVSKEKPSYYDR